MKQDMNKEQEKFWKVLSEPWERSCDNCINNQYRELPGGCYDVVGSCNQNVRHTNLNVWEWSGDG